MALTDDKKQEWLEGAEEFGSPLENKSLVPIMDLDEIDETVSMPALKYTDKTLKEPAGFRQVPMATFFNFVRNLIQPVETAISDLTTLKESTTLAKEQAAEQARIAREAAAAANTQVEETRNFTNTIKSWFNGENGFKATAENWLSSVQSSFNNWFGASADAGIRKTVSDWFTATQTAWNDWFSDSASTGTRKIWQTWFDSTKKAWNNWFSDSLSSGVRKIWDTWYAARQQDWNTLSTNVSNATNTANQAAQNANQKAALAEEKANYAQTKGDYAKNQGDFANAMGTHPPMIGEDGYWYNYDYATDEYVKTQIYAKGGATFVEFNINPDTLECEVEVPPEQEKTFELAEDGQVYINTDN